MTSIYAGLGALAQANRVGLVISAPGAVVLLGGEAGVAEDGESC